MDIVGGLLIAGALAAWVPPDFWQPFFLVDHPVITRIWGPIIGPLVAVIAFGCSVGNIPLAAAPWNGGIGFGRVIAFIFADLIVLPILNIYRKYYGPRMAGFLFVTFYASMAAAALIVEAIFGVLGPVPEQRHARVVDCFASSPAEPRNQFGGSSHLARCLRYAGNVLHDPLRVLRGPLHAAGDFLRRRARSPD